MMITKLHDRNYSACLSWGFFCLELACQALTVPQNILHRKKGLTIFFFLPQNKPNSVNHISPPQKITGPKNDFCSMRIALLIGVVLQDISELQ